MAGPLEGIRVLDLTQGVAGPFATKYFSDYGADVLKIERPGVGDLARRLGPFPRDRPDIEQSGLFLTLNTGKGSITLNLKTATGQHIVRRLAEDADIVIESFRPGTLERLGLGPDVLSETNPRASLVRLSNYGQTGPYRDWEGDDLTLYAMGGVLHVTATEGREPVKIGLYAPLFLAGAVTAAFTLGAFFSARQAGRGERADISIHEILATSMDRGGTNLVSWQYSQGLYFTAGQNPRTTALPNGVFPTMDGYVHVTVGPNWWDRFCRTIDKPEWITDERLLPNLLDINYAPEIDAEFYPWLLSHTKQEVMERAQAEGLPVGAINTMEDVAHDPHLAARNFFVEIDHPEAGRLKYPGLPFRMLGTPGAVGRAPLLGEHTSDVLTERLGYTAEDVVRLRQEGVV